ncbi:CCA tRNA nucleotidyltransferase [Liquorilactobacillus satsumensis]|uniref:CCA tRNA nucleotidyltransferase n=1 Tax=Liquorilactobacillus satsumensis TaxID=259059 RepID=UPI001E4438F3|nr:CCA tRNA nucleotidyltransferase [Liquorilactobacillus satsumensis]MCC7665973.1 CCA tRNA nucleotidyltransferase [Liquorilactobacillus satsumensis]MCP9312067.1 CCA tRNA nucleotidyltransferase [Liquorilactobacillus satsumensis]MCP9327846.1 CCA tRNA nucleotidyltransferase [Liquorilactobacillus satsumensis]MCP9356679.1 CCA tRNA nucleotidyltransferase [Liquorilactobacillus satsumensis]MCP9359345.1 CCA tRNA nucleotidyltransferase [Liquorilactobacillus satsumensis]
MRIQKLPHQFQSAKVILQRIQDAGFEAYFVGGCVRDTLLGVPLHDVDIATSAYPQEVKQLFKKTIDTGIEHGTVTVMDHGRAYEITTFRTESAYQDFRRPDKVEFVRSLAEDLKRRDLTINALAMDVNGQVIDLFAGLADLKNRVIRAVGDPHERFHEDALRMMRTVRFASKLDFKVEDSTLAAIAENAELLQKIAVERIYVEWTKLLLGKNPQRGLAAFFKTGLYQYCPLFFDKGKVLKQLLQFPAFTLQTEEGAWTLFCFLSGLSLRTATKLLKAWKSSNEMLKTVQKTLRILQIEQEKKLTSWDEYQAGLDCLLYANEAATVMGKGKNAAAIAQHYERLPIKTRHELAINGGDLLHFLAIKPSPYIGQLLDQLERAVVSGQLPNERQVLLQAAATAQQNHLE